jgi:uncharacterized protein
VHACRTADLFVKHTFFDPLAKGQDVLEGRHANTCVTAHCICWGISNFALTLKVLSCVPPLNRHLAQVNGFAARYEGTGDKNSLAATSGFWTQLTARHSYTSGGSNDNEFWGAPMRLGDTFQKASVPEKDLNG